MNHACQHFTNFRDFLQKTYSRKDNYIASFIISLVNELLPGANNALLILLCRSAAVIADQRDGWVDGLTLGSPSGRKGANDVVST